MPEAIRMWFDARIVWAELNYTFVGSRKPRSPRTDPLPRSLIEDFTRYTGRRAPVNLVEWVCFLGRERGWPIAHGHSFQRRRPCLIGIRIVDQPEFYGEDADPLIHHPRWLRKDVPLDEAKKLHAQRIATRTRIRREVHRAERQAAQQTPSPSKATP